jgi:YD repeat-containing protein
LNSNGNREREINERGKYTRYEFDKQNRLTFGYQQFEAREIKTEYQYENNGNRTHVTDARNNDTETKYDEWNRPYKVIDPENYETTTEYEGNGNQVKLTDGNGHERTWQRDQRGLVLTAADAGFFLTNNNPFPIHWPPESKFLSFTILRFSIPRIIT